MRITPADQEANMKIYSKSGKAIYEGECKTAAELLELAVKSGADLAEANLRGANLAGANLAGLIWQGLI
jgi:uncharacterized protein YjbI with pentapeptide repeats